MKLRNLFYLLLALPLAFASCDKDPEVEYKDPELTLTSQAEMSFTAAGGDGEITYKLENPKSGVKVEAKADAAWVSIKGTEGKVNFAVEANEEETAREAKIVVSYEKLSFEVTVKQAAAEPVVEDPELTLTSADEVTFAAEGGAGEITYTLANPVEGVEVTAKADTPWVANFVVEAEKITYNVAPNAEQEAREAVITVEYGVLSFNVAVKQAAAEPVAPQSLTIAEAIALEDDAAITLKDVTIAGVYARGVLVSDATGKLLVYAGSAVEAAIGDVVTVEGTMATYAGLRQVATPTVTKTGTTTYEHPAVEVLDGAAMDAYLAAPAVKYVEYTGTLSISGSYYNVTVEGASTAIGSIAYPIAGSVKAENGQKIKVRGYAIGVSSGKYVNTMLVECEAFGDTPEITVVEATVAEFLNAEESTTVLYELTGKIANVVAEKTYYGNFDLVDETGSVYIYGLVDADNQYGIFEAKGLKEGDTITLRTVRTSYKDTPQGKNALYVSHVAGEGGETPEPEVYDVELAYVERYYDVDDTELPANHFLLGMIDVEEAIEFAVLFKGAEGDTVLKAGNYSTADATIDVNNCELYDYNLDEPEVAIKSVEATVAEAEGLYTLTFKVVDEAGNTYNFNYEGEIVNMVVEEEEQKDPVLYLLSERNVDVRAAGGEFAINYQVENPVSGVSVTATADAKWITIGDITSNSIKYTVAENKAAQPRSATITVAYGEQTATVSVNQGSEVTYTPIAVRAEVNDGGKTWVIILTEKDVMLGEPTTKLTFKLAEANTLFLTDGTYSVANGGIVPGNQSSVYRYNTSTPADINNAEITVAVDVKAHNVTLNGTFAVGNANYALNWSGDIDGFLYEDLAAEPLTEWNSFRLNSTFEDCYVLYGQAKNGVTVEFFLHALGAKAKTEALSAGEYPVGDWQYTTANNYCENSAGGVNGYKLTMGKVTVAENGGTYTISFNVIDTNGTEWSGEYTGTL